MTPTQVEAADSVGSCYALTCVTMGSKQRWCQPQHTTKYDKKRVVALSLGLLPFTWHSPSAAEATETADNSNPPFAGSVMETIHKHTVTSRTVPL
eukprot:5936244-Amphidinium_carterae.1